MEVFVAILVFSGLTAGCTVLLIIAERFWANYGPCTIDINNGGKQLGVQGGRTLLSCLYEHRIFIPSACGGKGTCSYCKITVVSGAGKVLPTERPYLSRIEIKAGMRLACQVKVKQNLVVRIPEEMLNVKLYRTSVVSIRDLTYDIKEIRLSLSDPAEISAKPGQYVQVEIPTSSEPVFRAYSISSPVSDTRSIELNVRLVQGGAGSTYLHRIKPGDTVGLTGPYGEFRLNEDPGVELVLVGGGAGMAPV